ncbi:MAG: hypothetical protein LBS65_01170 [Desulfovibrio sp.]|jgi:ParB family chromosome partitioning protein|nr:hypothetical protein [Desulfovibrio sp.]
MASTRKWDANSHSKSQERNIAKVQTACVQDNKALALSVSRKDVDRCAKVIRQYGLLTPPVIGKLNSGEQVLLSGECEFQALREIGVKNVDAVTIPISERDEGDRLSLLLSSFKKNPGALSEGILITQLFQRGSYTQSQLGELLGKSVSWVNKRIGLATRLDPAVKELMAQGLLCPRSAQEIARLPAEAQHGFSVEAVRRGLPKSAIEAMVAAFNAPSCPDEIKKQIVSDPGRTMERLRDTRRARAIRQRPADVAASTAKGRLDAFRQHMANIIKDVCAMSLEEMDRRLLAGLRSDIAEFLLLIDRKLSFSLGKTGEGDSICGN